MSSQTLERYEERSMGRGRGGKTGEKIRKTGRFLTQLYPKDVVLPGKAGLPITLSKLG